MLTGVSRWWIGRRRTTCLSRVRRDAPLEQLHRLGADQIFVARAAVDVLLRAGLAADLFIDRHDAELLFERVRRRRKGGCAAANNDDVVHDTYSLV